MIVRTFDQQIGQWIREAKHLYGIETFPNPLYKKILFGARAHFKNADAHAARSFVYRQISKRWQYLNEERIVEFIETEFSVECELHK